MAITVPVISEIDYPPEPVMPAELAPVVWEAYSELVQNLIDGEITDFSQHYAKISSVKTELALLKDKVFREFHKRRRELMAKEGPKGHQGMPGYLIRALGELELDERRTLSEEGVKITAKYVEMSLDNVYRNIENGIASEELRSKMWIENQTADYSVAKAALEAAFRNAENRINMYESSLKTIETNFKLAETEARALAQYYEALSEEVKVLIVQTEAIGITEELERLSTEIQAAYKQIEAEQARIPLILKEIDKVSAELEILIAEQALAVFKQLTAQASMEKSQARQSEIAVTQGKIQLELDRVALQTTKEEADTQSEISQIEARKAEEQIDNAKQEIALAGDEAEANLVAIRTDITNFQALTAEQKVDYFNARANDLSLDLTTRAQYRLLAIGQRTITERAKLTAATNSQISNIQTEAANTVAVIEASTENTRESLQAQIDLLRVAVEATLANQAAAHAASLATKQEDYDVRVEDYTTDLNTMQQTNEDLMARSTSDFRTLILSLIDIIVTEQAQYSYDTSNKITELRSQYDTWKASYEASTQGEANSIKAAATSAADATVHSTLIRS